MTTDDSATKGEQRRLLSGFEALVRSQENLAGSSLENLAERFHGQWIAAGRPWLVFHAKGMAVADGPVHEFDPAEARWLIVLFMAGLHRIRLEDTSNPGQLLDLCATFHSGQPTLDGLGKLRDYFWAGGAIGFETELRRSFSEALDLERALSARPELFPRRLLRRMQLSDSPTGQHALSSSNRTGFDPNQMERLTQLAAEADEDEIRLGPEADKLKAAVSDEQTWSRIEREVVRQYPTLQRDLPPAALVGAIDEFVDSGRLDWALSWLTALLERVGNDPRLEEALQKSNPVERLTAEAVLDDETQQNALLEFGRTAPKPQRARLIASLLQRGVKEDAAIEVLGRMNTEDLLALAPRKELDPPRTEALFEAIVRSDAPANSAAALLAELPAPLRLAAIPALNDRLLSSAQACLVEAIVAASGEGPQDKVLLALARKESGAADRVLIESVEQGADQGASRGALVGYCTALARIPPEGSRLVGIVHDGSASEMMRLAAFTALARYPEQRAKAAARRAGELLYPSRLKKVLSQARKQGGKR